MQLILFDRTSSYHRLTNEFFRGAGALPRGVMELDNIDAAKKMVEQGLGVALLPHTAVAGELEAGTLKAVTLFDAPQLKREIVILRRRDAGPATGRARSLSELPVGPASGASGRRSPQAAGVRPAARF